jgi:hypothetical protein
MRGRERELYLEGQRKLERVGKILALTDSPNNKPGEAQAATATLKNFPWRIVAGVPKAARGMAKALGRDRKAATAKRVASKRQKRI